MGLPRFRVRLRRGALLRAPGVTLRVALGEAPPELPFSEEGFEAATEPVATPPFGVAPVEESPFETAPPPALAPVEVAEPLEATATVAEPLARVAEIATAPGSPSRPPPEVGFPSPAPEIPGNAPEESVGPSTVQIVPTDTADDTSRDRTPAASPTDLDTEAVEPLPPLPEGLHTEDFEAPRRWSTSAVVALTAAITFAATAALFALVVGRPEAPSNADERRARLETQEVRRELELEEQRLAGLAQAVAEDDTRVAASWTRLGVEARALADEHDRSLTAARALGDRLDVLVARTAELASGSSPVAPRLRPEVRRLETEARAYRTILDRVMTEIEAQRRIALDHAESADTRAHQRELLGVVVRVIHDPERLADARRLVALLEGAGAEAHLFLTRLDDPSPHKGRLYYRGPEDQNAARRIARLVEAIEPIDPEPVGRANPFLSLWVVGLPPIPEPVDDDLDGLLETEAGLDGLLETEDDLDGLLETEDDLDGLLETEAGLDGLLETEDDLDGGLSPRAEDSGEQDEDGSG